MRFNNNNSSYLLYIVICVKTITCHDLQSGNEIYVKKSTYLHIWSLNLALLTTCSSVLTPGKQGRISKGKKN